MLLAANAAPDDRHSDFVIGARGALFRSDDRSGNRCGRSRDRQAPRTLHAPGSARAGGFPTFGDKSQAAQLAQDVVEMANVHGWKVEGMYSERGELDEVFRRITLPDTVKK